MYCSHDLQLQYSAYPATHDKQFTLLTTRTQYRGSSFLPKTIRDWNSLPMEVVEAPTRDAFMSRVSN